MKEKHIEITLRKETNIDGDKKLFIIESFNNIDDHEELPTCYKTKGIRFYSYRGKLILCNGPEINEVEALTPSRIKYWVPLIKKAKKRLHKIKKEIKKNKKNWKGTITIKI